MFPLLVVLIVLGSYALYYFIIKTVLLTVSHSRLLLLEVTILDFVSKNIAKFHKLTLAIIAKCVALRATFYIYCWRNKPCNDPELLHFY